MFKECKMELKTLKDLNATEWKNNHSEKVEDWVKLEELKAEAIKWIKERKFLPVPKGVIPATHHAYMHGEREFIKHFFNLTEADLTELKGGIIDNE